MTQDPWLQPLDALSRADAPVRLWLRDDDAVTVTPGLDRLADLCGAAGMPLTLASIPGLAEDALGAWAATRPHVAPVQHGWRHHNHAVPPARACELGGERHDGAVLAELAEGRRRTVDLFGPAAATVLVPPWNRIRESLIPALPAAGYAALSAYGAPPLDPASPLPRLDATLDIIDWRAGGVGRTMADLCARLTAQIGIARESGAPVGILTHHRAHDERAWAFLEAAMTRLPSHPMVRFARFGDLVGL